MTRKSPLARVSALACSCVATLTIVTWAPVSGAPSAFTVPSRVMVFWAIAGRVRTAAMASAVKHRKSEERIANASD